MSSRRITIVILFSSAVLYIIFTASSGGRATVANAGNTGAPGETQTCSNCHSGGNFGTVAPLIQVFQLGTNSAVTSYQGGTTYDVRVTVQFTAGAPAGFGFQMTALTTLGNSALSGYSNLASNVKQKTLTSGQQAGRTYVEHNGVGSSNVFNMRWTAPPAGTGSVSFYAAGNAVNVNGGTSGDKAGTASITLTEAQPLSVSGVVTNVNCFGGSTGAINITATGGSSPYTYNWGGGVTTKDRTNLPAGNYTVTVTDNAGSTVSSTFSVTQPSAALSLTGTVTDVSCYGAGTGAINITASGGTAPYAYSWTGGITSEDRNGLPAGTYAVTVTDSRSCTVAASFTVSQPGAALSLTGTVTDVSCYGASTGAINITASGGTAPYAYSWTGGITSEDRSGLPAGNYSVTITDGHGCSTGNSFTVTEPAQLVPSAMVETTDCMSGTTVITVSASGGTPPYAGTGTFHVSAGSSTFHVSDASGCTDSVIIVILDSCTVIISGSIVTQTGMPVSGVAVTLSGDDHQMMLTGTDGKYGFSVRKGGNYTVTPAKNNDVMITNGISVLDLLLIQQHILTFQSLDSPYKVIAADVNGSQTVSIVDMVLIRSLILANISAFPNGRLWEFVASDQVFANPQGPFPIQNSRSYTRISQSYSSQDFIGIKLGDVNNSWDATTP